MHEDGLDKQFLNNVGIPGHLGVCCSDLVKACNDLTRQWSSHWDWLSITVVLAADEGLNERMINVHLLHAKIVSNGKRHVIAEQGKRISA